jgi:hypothetical protein
MSPFVSLFECSIPADLAHLAGSAARLTGRLWHHPSTQQIDMEDRLLLLAEWLGLTRLLWLARQFLDRAPTRFIFHLPVRTLLKLALVRRLIEQIHVSPRVQMRR